MTDQGPPGNGEERHWLDRDTEPIPRARYEPEPGRHAASDRSGSDRSGSDRSGSDPAAGPGDAPGREDDPFLDEPTPFADEAEQPPADDRPRPRPRRGAHRDPGDRFDADPLDADPTGPPRETAASARDGRSGGDDDFVPAGGTYRGRAGAYDDDATVFHEFPDDLDGEPGRYSRPSTVGASFVVGEPITEEELGGLRGASTPLVTSRRVVPLEDEPSPLVQRYLFPTEKFRGEWRRHPIELAKEIGIAALVTVCVGLLAGYLARINAADEISGVLVFAWFGVILWAAWKIVDWWFDRFILTNKRVMVVSGVITRNVAMMPLQRVTDMKYLQSALGRVLNYGTFELESAGQDQALRSIPHLPSPNELYLRIVEEMYEPEAVEARLAGAQDVIDDGT
jgi:membrane protein YdbS with pleckstrin-like domain